MQNTRVRFVPNFTRLSFYRHFGQAPTIQFIAISLFSSLHNARRFYYLEKSMEVCEMYFSFIFITYNNQIWINSINTTNIQTEKKNTAHNTIWQIIIFILNISDNTDIFILHCPLYIQQKIKSKSLNPNVKSCIYWIVYIICGI